MGELIDRVDQLLEESEESAGFVPKLPGIYYNPAGKDFYIPEKRGGWVCVGSSGATSLLKAVGFSPKKGEEDLQSPLEAAMLRIQTEHNVDYAGALAGQPKGLMEVNDSRLLITSEAKRITPKQGSWDLIKTLLENLFGHEQIPYVYGWLKISLETFETREWQPGQAFCMCGPAGSGKNLARSLFTKLLGNRFQDPWQFMTGATPFNSELFGAECLAIEDKAESIDIRARCKFGSSIKQITANQDQRFHRKNEEGLALQPLWRLFISLNDEPERLGVLPPMAGDIEDKLMLFLVQKHSLPMPTRNAAEKKKFFSALSAQLPAFAFHLCYEHVIAEELACDRFGIRHFHHPSILEKLEGLSPESHLLDMIDEVIAPHRMTERQWSGRAAKLQRRLTDELSPCRAQATRLLTHSNSCGTYLGRLARNHPDRISSCTVKGHAHWTIKANPDLIPAGLAQTGASEGRSGEAAFRVISR